MGILACPMCKGALELAVDGEEEDEVVKGRAVERRPSTASESNSAIRCTV